MATKKTFEFILRHFVTLIILGIIGYNLVRVPLNWGITITLLSVAVIVDWLKQFWHPPS